MSNDYYVDCCNEDCGWSGPKSETVHPKHVPDLLLCPECHEVVGPVGEPWGEGRKPEEGA